MILIEIEGIAERLETCGARDDRLRQSFARDPYQVPQVVDSLAPRLQFGVRQAEGRAAHDVVAAAAGAIDRPTKQGSTFNLLINREDVPSTAASSTSTLASDIVSAWRVSAS